MYPTSSQRKYCTFTSEQQLNELRLQHNTEFIAKHGEVSVQIRNKRKKIRFLSYFSVFLQYQADDDIFLTAEEERTLLRAYELHLKEFCKRFEPPMPRSVTGTAFHYFKRFYLYNSPMDYHPKEIL